MLNIFELADAMTGCLLGGTVIGQLAAVGVLIAIVLIVLFTAARFLGSRLTAPVLIVGIVVVTGVAVYAVGSTFAIFEKDRGDLHPTASRHDRCKDTGEVGTEASLDTWRIAARLP